MIEVLNRKVLQMATIRSAAVALSLFLQIWLVATFGAATYGDYVIFVTLCSLVTIISIGGLDTQALKISAIDRSVSGRNAKLDLLHSPFITRGLIFTTICCLIIWCLSSFNIDYFSRLPIFSWTLLYVATVGAVTFQILIAVLRGIGRPVLADLFDAIIRNTFTGLIALFLTAAFTATLNHAVMAYAFSFYFCLFAIVLVTGIRPAPPATRDTPKPQYTTRMHFGFMLTGLVSYAFFQLDTLILSAQVSATELGAYNMACNLVRAVIFIPLILVVLIQPRIAVEFERNNFRAVARIAAAGIGLSIFAAIGCAVALWMIGGYILSLIAPEFLVAREAMLILSAAHVVNSALIIVAGVISMSGRFFDIAKAQVVGSIVSVALYIVLIPLHGQQGAALSVLIGLVAVGISYIFLYRSLIPRIYGFLLP